MEARLAERDGARLEVAFENEFSLAVRDDGAYVPVDSSLCFSTIGMTDVAGLRRRPRRRARAQGIPLEQYYAELGHGQQEISTAHAPALRAADEQLLVRETIRGVAAQHGLVASLAPKPWPDGAGNGCHIHFSLWSGERNRFHDAAADDRLSAEAHAFLAGVLAHLPALCGLTAPSFNSYHRIVPQYWAGAFTCWGHDNREAPIRVPSVFDGMEEASTNVELKAADASCNPYLAVGGLIAAGLDGLERGLELPPPVEVDPATIARTSAPRAASCACRRRRRRRSTRSRPTRCSSTRSGRCSRRRTSPSAARSGTPTPQETRHSSSRVTSRSTERGRPRRPARARDPAHAAGDARRVSRALLRELRSAPVAARRDRPHVPARDPRPRGALRHRADGGGGLRAPAEQRSRRVRVVAPARDEHRLAARRRRLPAAGHGHRVGAARRARRLPRAAGAADRDARDDRRQRRSRRRASSR